MRGRNASSRIVGAGCDGRLPRRACSQARRNAAAYGEVVWFWRRDPGATCGRSPPAQRGQERPLPGKSAYKPSTHCAGKAGLSRLYLSNPCAPFCYTSHTASGRSQRPVFPAPSVRERADELAKLRRNRAVRMSAHVSPSHREERNDAMTESGPPPLSTGNDRSCTGLPA